LVPINSKKLDIVHMESIGYRIQLIFGSRWKEKNGEKKFLEAIEATFIVKVK